MIPICPLLRIHVAVFSCFSAMVRSEGSPQMAAWKPVMLMARNIDRHTCIIFVGCTAISKDSAWSMASCWRTRKAPVCGIRWWSKVDARSPRENSIKGAVLEELWEEGDMNDRGQTFLNGEKNAETHDLPILICPGLSPTYPRSATSEAIL